MDASSGVARYSQSRIEFQNIICLAEMLDMSRQDQSRFSDPWSLTLIAALLIVPTNMVAAQSNSVTGEWIVSEGQFGDVVTDYHVDSPMLIEGEIIGIYEGVITSIVEHDTPSANADDDTEAPYNNQDGGRSKTIAEPTLPAPGETNTTTTTATGDTESVDVEDSDATDHEPSDADAADQSLAAINRKIEQATRELLRVHRETQSFAKQSAAIKKQLEKLSKLTGERDKMLRRTRSEVDKNKREIRKNSQKIKQLSNHAKEVAATWKKNERQLKNVADAAKGQVRSLEGRLREIESSLAELTRRTDAVMSQHHGSPNSDRSDLRGIGNREIETDSDGDNESDGKVGRLRDVMGRLKRVSARVDRLSTFYDRLMNGLPNSGDRTETASEELRTSIQAGRDKLEKNRRRLSDLMRRVSDNAESAVGGVQKSESDSDRRDTRDAEPEAEIAGDDLIDV